MLNKLESNLVPMIPVREARTVRRLLLMGWYAETPIEEQLDQIMTALASINFNHKRAVEFNQKSRG